MTDIVERINSLTPEKRALLLQRLMKGEGGKSGIYPASYAQRRLWFIDQLEPNSALYNVPAAVRLTMSLDIPALERALNEVVCRHDILRTSFISIDGEPMQLVAPDCAVTLSVTDLSMLPERERAERAQALLNEESRRGFDLRQAPLLRASLLRLSEDEHVLLLNLHHIVSDGWSSGLLIRELTSLYAAFSKGEPSPLPELSIQYADFAIWQRGWLTGNLLDSQLSYWRQQLAGAPPRLELPTDYPRPAVQSYRGATCPVLLDAGLSAELRALSRRHGVTLFMTLLAGFQLLLSRYTGQDEIVVGTPIAGRTRAEVEGLIGFFVNTLALRQEVRRGESFAGLLRRVRESCLGAYAHQEVPFERVVEELAPERALNSSPLFQTTFALQNGARVGAGGDGSGAGVGEGAGLEGAGGDSGVGSLEVETGTTKYELMLSLAEAGAEIRGSIHYSTELFVAERVRAMAAHYEELLRSVVRDESGCVWSLGMMREEERHQCLSHGSGGRKKFETKANLAELFEAQAARTPEKVALVCEGESLTYAELNARANRLAHHLRAQGVGPEVLVGLFLDRTAQLPLSVLAVLKAGGAYLPLDPVYPAERLSFMLADSGVGLLLTERDLLSKIPEYAGQTIVVEELAQHLSDYPTTNLPQSGDDENLAYVIYTSGSTGQPKGTLVTHSNVARLFEATAAEFRFDAEDVWTLFHSYAFDFSVWEMWGALLYGGKLVVVPYLLSRSPEAFNRLLHEERVTVLNQTPTAFRQLMAVDAQTGSELSLRLVIFGGEALEPESLRGWFERHGDERPQLVNMYGITETTVHVTRRALRRSDALACAGSPIGEPLADLELYVLDELLNPVPKGVTGELYVGGEGLARGYLGRPGLTATSFIPHPYGLEAGARLYRTGDLARFNVEGELEYKGRRDQQVKLRGFRIELGEIEAVLEAHESVQTAVVLLRGAAEDAHLVAYLVAAAETLPNGGDLRLHLRTRLPEYMIPAHYVVLEQLPLTNNGKINRRALTELEIETEGSAVESGGEAPTAVEEIVMGIWAEVLRLERVGVGDNFFDLGGHSLLATQVVSRIRETFGVELGLRKMFEGPTVAALARTIEEEMVVASARPSVPEVTKVSRFERLPLSYAQQRLWFLDQLAPGNPLYNIPVAVRLHGPLDIPALEQAITEIVRRHEAMRTSFAFVDGEAIQFINPPQPYTLMVIDLSDTPEEERESEVQSYANAAASEAFDLSSGQLLRAGVLRLGDEENVVLMTLHHIAGDGWSMNVLVRELSLLYRAYCAGLPSPLPELSLQYADYAVWQRRWLEGEVLDSQLHYWKQQLDGMPSLLDLPTTYPRPAAQRYRGSLETVVLPATLTDAVKALSRRQGVTLFMTLLAAFKLLLSRYTGQTDICVGTPIAGRTRQEFEELIGLFINTLVLRTDLSGDPTVKQMLERVREVTLGAYTHQDVPFERLVEELQPERDMSRSPLFQVMMVLQNTGGPAERRMASPDAESVPVKSGWAKYDLTLFLSEEAGSLQGVLEYNTDLFDATAVRQMFEHFRLLLEAMVADPERHVSQLPILGEEEQRQLVSRWNQTETPYPQGLCVHQLFESQAGRTPEAVAVRFEDERLTYRELNERANRLANYLKRAGVGAESRVGIVMEPSVEMVLAVLGILKAGAAYVPFDAAWPEERQGYVMRDAGVCVVLTQGRLKEGLPATGCEVLSLDEDWERVSVESPEEPPSDVDANNLAYLIYTSGSTGRPKGVMIPHSGVVNYLSWAVGAYGDSRGGEGVGGGGSALHSSLAFDLTVTSLFVPLLKGEPVTLMPQQQSLERLSAVLSAGRDEGAGRAVSLLKITPSHLQLLNHLLLDAGREGHARYALPEVMVVGGEALFSEHLQWWGHESPATRIINEYGPTETVVGSCVFEVGEQHKDNRAVPIGRPIANTRVYVLDSNRRPVPLGVFGELYIGGAGVGRGYLGQAAMTAEKFVPDSFSGEAGARLYRTGDLVRYLPDGNLEYRGRIDDQVKVRGHRIELGEVEATLRSHASVAEALAAAPSDEQGEKWLVAYVVFREGQAPTSDELRQHLRRWLPEHMIPSAFVRLEAIPLTANGKVNRKALPAPERALDITEYVAPRTEVEETLALIWAEALKVERVGVEDNFFELGGHSLLAAQLIARVREMFNCDFPLRAVFEFPTVAEMAGALLALGWNEGVSEGEPPIERVSREGALHLSLTQEHAWSSWKLKPNVTGPRTSRNMNAIFRLKGPLKFDALERALVEIGRRHEILRTTYAEVEGNIVPLIAPTLSDVLSVVDLQALPWPEREQEVRRLVTEYSLRPFDLAGELLLRATLLRLDAQDHVLVFVIDHFIFDDRSKDVFMNELADIYHAFYHDQPSPLPELEVQFIDWAEWQRNKFSGEAAKKFIDFWRERLDVNNPFPRLELPQVLPPPAVLTRRGQTHRKVLPNTVLEKLEALGSDRQVTMFMVHLAVLNTVLHAYTGKEQIGVITNVANRERPEAQRLFGCLTNQLILPTDLSGDPSFSRLLERVREMCMSVFEHADLPLPYLMTQLKDGEDPFAQPVVPPYVFLGVEPDRRAAQQSIAEQMQMADLTIEPVSPAPSGLVGGTGIYVNVFEVAEGLKISIESGVDQYLPETMAEVLELYCRVVESVVEDPEQTLSELTRLLHEEVEVFV